MSGIIELCVVNIRRLGNVEEVGLPISINNVSVLLYQSI